MMGAACLRPQMRGHIQKVPLLVGCMLHMLWTVRPCELLLAIAKLEPLTSLSQGHDLLCLSEHCPRRLHQLLPNHVREPTPAAPAAPHAAACCTFGRKHIPTPPPVRDARR